MTARPGVKSCTAASFFRHPGAGLFPLFLLTNFINPTHNTVSLGVGLQVVVVVEYSQNRILLQLLHASCQNVTDPVEL